jgi:thioesterase domain-containing protein
MGGSSVRAAEIFSKIARATGKQLPLSTLIANQTIEKLAVFIARGEKPTSCLVPIQTQGSKPPLFCVHGGWGHVLFYRHLAKHLGSDQPLYALQAKGLSGNETPYDDLVKIAANYIREIRSVQPNGPYYLAGYCFGAIAAFEMAQQLVAAGDKVAFLGSFNGIAPRMAMARPEASKNIPLPAAKNKPRSLRKRLKIVKIYMMVMRYRMLIKMRSLSYRFFLARGRSMPQALRRWYIVDALGRALDSYTPKPYPGELFIFRSPQIFKSPHLGWTQLISGGIKTYDIPGHHPNRTRIMYEPFVPFLAEALKKQLVECTLDFPIQQKKEDKRRLEHLNK